MRLSAPQSRRDWIAIGFFCALGVALLIVLSLSVWKLGTATLNVIAPFAIGMTLALLLDPLVDDLTRRGVNRMLSVAIVFGLLIVIIGALASLFVPTLIDQTGQLARNAPGFVETMRHHVNAFLQAHRHIGLFKLPQTFDDLFSQGSQQLTAFLQRSTGSITQFLLGSVSTLFQLVVSLIITFYLLLDIDRLRARLLYLLPESARVPATQYSTDIGGVFADYLRGQFFVCALYGAATILLLYFLSLWHHGLAGYALLVGVAAGLLYAVPYIGAIVTLLLTFLVAFADGGASFGLVTMGANFALNLIFDYALTPKIVGGGVGLHPVAALFALTLGGDLFGLPGILLSVPLAAAVQVILFRLFPKLTEPTPPVFLRAEGVAPGEPESAKTRAGDEPKA